MAARRMTFSVSIGSNEGPHVRLFNDVVDVLRGSMLTGDLRLCLECVELLGRQAPSAYVVGLSRTTWMWVMMQTTVGGRYLPPDASLTYGGFSCVGADDVADECFLLGSLLSIIHDLLELQDLDLVLKLLENLSAEGLLASVVGLENSVWMNLKTIIAQRLAEAAGARNQAFDLTRLRGRRGAYDDIGELRLDDADRWCELGLEHILSNTISTRRVPFTTGSSSSSSSASDEDEELHVMDE
eukprot:TRINITY_DN21963_c0_g1_i1.p2 TRINITY_DN21963_c0_g1~~TRINITY_DN21963_c0_g1_i1.p2  ORF type:complete len:241 (+),score=38.32 TRINITY_DN21963_c0_g1_i1:105-827(+)